MEKLEFRSERDSSGHVVIEDSRRQPGREGDAFVNVSASGVWLTPAEMRTVGYELLSRAAAGEEIQANQSED